MRNTRAILGRLPQRLWFPLALAVRLTSAGAESATVTLPAVITYSTRVANQSPGTTMGMPVSALRFEPAVDVQARNLAEGQADIAVRGGLFENTGFRIGGVAIPDPQTGHYLAEAPVPPQMLGEPRIATGADNASMGFNAMVGTVAFGWREIQPRGEAAVGAGQFGLARQEYYQGLVFPGGIVGRQIAADVAVGHSQSDGPIAHGDHDFTRVGGRLQVRGVGGQTDLFAGYQSKFFGWPNLYTPFNSEETDHLQTSLFALNHRVELGGESHWQVAGFYRRNKDDYAFNRLAPVGPIHPFQHTTWERGVAVAGSTGSGGWKISYAAQLTGDFLHSTALTFGRFHSRTTGKFSLIPETSFAAKSGDLVVRAGATFDDSNRDASAVSPVLRAEWKPRPSGSEAEVAYLEYAEATQLPTYTALNSNPNAGLFRGNSNLGRERSRNVEIGLTGQRSGWRAQAALFHRQDRNLVDWTFRRGVTARNASAVDVDTTGVELVASRKSRRFDVTLGYTLLHKAADYGPAAVEASFYALNFAKHRLTAAGVLRLGRGFEARLDNEFRIQEKNSLRTAGGDEAVLTSLGLYYLPRQLWGLEFSLLVDNLWASAYQEVPAVPAAGRQVSGGVTWRW